MKASELEALIKCEEALGENLVWLADAFDISIRQKDPEILRKLKQMNDAWVLACKAIANAK